MNSFTDTHCHVLSSEYSNINHIIDNLENNKIKRIIINGFNMESNIEVLSLCKKYINVYGAFGIHPDNIDNYNETTINFIKDNINEKKIIAIGEIGLDYFHNKENKIEQIKLFDEMLTIAENNKLPVIIHNRDATEDIIRILKKHNVNGIIHCFNGSYETAEIYLKLGLILGINGVLTFKNSKLGEILKRLPLSSFVLETDSPYLTPEPFRGQPNEPKYIKYTAIKLASLFNISLADMSHILEENYKSIFDKQIIV